MDTLATFTPEGILVSGDQVGTVTGAVTILAGSGIYMAGAILALDESETEKCVKFADGGTPYAVLSQAVDASGDEDVEAIAYFTGQFTESVMTAANEGVDLEAVRPALRALNTHIQTDVA